MTDNTTEDTKPEIKLRMARKKFQEEVESLVGEGVTYIDAIQSVCDKNDIEVEGVSFYVTGVLKERVTEEAKRNFLLKRELCEREQPIELPL